MCEQFGLLKFGIFYDWQRNEARIFLYSCCDKMNFNISFSISEFEEILNLSNRKFEKWINSYFNQLSDTKGNGACGMNVPSIKKFYGVEAGLNMSCNIRCKFCIVETTREKIDEETSKKLKEIYFKFLKKVSECNFSVIEMTCNGEPFFYKKDFYDFLRNIPKKSKLEKILITTNSLLIDDEFIEIVKNSHLRFQIVSSINGWDVDSYKYLMGTDGFDKVIKNAEKLQELENLKLFLSFVITEYTIKNKLSFFDSLKELNQKFRCILRKEVHMPNEIFTNFKNEYISVGCE